MLVGKDIEVEQCLHELLAGRIIGNIQVRARSHSKVADLFVSHLEEGSGHSKVSLPRAKLGGGRLSRPRTKFRGGRSHAKVARLWLTKEAGARAGKGVIFRGGVRCLHWHRHNSVGSHHLAKHWANGHTCRRILLKRTVPRMAGVAKVATPDDMAQSYLLPLPRPPPSHVGVSQSPAAEGVWQHM